MKKLLFICLAVIGLTSCSYDNYAPEFDKGLNPFFRSQWTAIEENGTSINRDEIIFDFDLYENRCLTFYKKKDYRNGNKPLFKVQSYKASRTNEITWVIQDFYYNETYCDIVIQMSSYYVEDCNYAELRIYDDGVVLDKYVISKNHEITDLNSLAVKN